MIRDRLSYVLRLATILLPALIAGLAAQLPIPAEGHANATPLVVETWNGISNTQWNNSFNWTPNGDPTLSDLCIIPAGKPNYPFIFGADIGQCGGITIDSGGQIKVQGATLQSATAIDVNGTLSVIGNSVLQAGDLIVVNPNGLLILTNVGTAIHFTANGFLSVNGTVQLIESLSGLQMTGPNPPTETANLIVHPGGLFDILDKTNSGFTLDGSVTNQGTMRQTASVSSPTRFLSITSAYIGVVITPATTSLDSTSVAVQGNQTCSGQPQSVKRCFQITPTNFVKSTVQFFYLSSEANGNNTPSVFHFNTGTASWQALASTRGGSGVNLFAQAAGITSYSPFELRNPFSLFLPIVRR